MRGFVHWVHESPHISGVAGGYGAMSWTSRSRVTLSAIITLSPPSGTLNSMPNSLREIDPVALNPARVD